jgi:hypothetical protein
MNDHWIIDTGRPAFCDSDLLHLLPMMVSLALIFPCLIIPWSFKLEAPRPFIERGSPLREVVPLSSARIQPGSVIGHDQYSGAPSDLVFESDFSG